MLRYTYVWCSSFVMIQALLYYHVFFGREASAPRGGAFLRMGPIWSDKAMRFSDGIDPLRTEHPEIDQDWVALLV